MHLPRFNDLATQFARDGNLSDAELDQLVRAAGVEPLTAAEEGALNFLGGRQIDTVRAIRDQSASHRSTVKIARDLIAGGGMPEGADPEFVYSAITMLRGVVPEDIQTALSIGDSWSRVVEKIRMKRSPKLTQYN